MLGRRVLRPLFHSVAMTKSTEFFMAACLLVVLGTALIAAVSGLSMALGAFIAGLLLAETEYRREIEATIEPFKGLLLGLFFVAVGAELDLLAAVRLARADPADRGGLVLVKALALLILGAPSGCRPRRPRSRAAAGPRGRIRLRHDRRGGRRRIVGPKTGQTDPCRRRR